MKKVDKEKQDIERKINVVLVSGEEIEYYPTHLPVSIREQDKMLSFAWRQADGGIFWLTINPENVAVLERISRPEDQDPGVLDLIEQARARDKAGDPA